MEMYFLISKTKDGNSAGLCRIKLVDGCCALAFASESLGQQYLVENNLANSSYMSLSSQIPDSWFFEFSEHIPTTSRCNKIAFVSNDSELQLLANSPNEFCNFIEK